MRLRFWQRRTTRNPYIKDVTGKVRRIVKVRRAG